MIKFNKKLIRGLYIGFLALAAAAVITLFAVPFRGHVLWACLVLALVLLLLAAGAVVLYEFALARVSRLAFPMGGGGQDPLNSDPGWIAASAEEDWMQSRDGLRLHAWRVRSGSHKTAVICHGYRCKAADMTASARHFAGLGMNLLLPDARGHGKSEGSYVGMGWHERKDITDWCKRLAAEDPQAEILLYGVSMGGATVMMTAGEADLPAAVRCVVEDCGYSSVGDEMAYQLEDMFGLPAFPLLPMADLVTRLRAGYGFSESSAVEQLKKCRLPMLFIHGDQDTFVPYAMLAKVYPAAAGEKEKLVVEGAGHAMSCADAPELYWSTVDSFIARMWEKKA